MLPETFDIHYLPQTWELMGFSLRTQIWASVELVFSGRLSILGSSETFLRQCGRNKST